MNQLIIFDGVHFGECPYDQAKAHIERWHYSGRIPTATNIAFGVWVDGILYAVADYGIGVNPYAAGSLSRLTGFPINGKKLLELTRLARVDDRHNDIPLTRLLSYAHKRLRALGYEWVVSYSDPNHGHTGGIYRAASFLHCGKTNAEWHVIDAEGNTRHRRFAFRHARRAGCTIAESRATLNLSRVKTLPKDRWLQCIGPQTKQFNRLRSSDATGSRH